MYDEEPEESEKRAIRQKSFAFQLIGRTIYQHSITLACTSRSSDDNVISSILYFDDGTESNEEENWCKEAVYLFKQYIYIYIYRGPLPLRASDNAASKRSRSISSYTERTWHGQEGQD